MSRKRAINKLPKLFDRLHPAKHAKIVRLRQQGLSQRLVALEVGVSQATVSRVMSAHYESVATPLSASALSLELVRREWPDDSEQAAHAIAIYRNEKARAEQRRAFKPVLQEAKQDFVAALAREKEAKKGGRPKASGRGGQKPMGAFGKQRRSDFRRELDLCDLLPAYYGRSA
jgi:hypothetical protein